MGNIKAMRSAFTTLGRKLVAFLSKGFARIQPVARSFLRSVGLKLLAFSSQGERKKVVVSGSRTIAIARTGVHILPITITIFLIALNGKVLLNGPQISTVAVFFLQVAAKLHELTIVGSLTAIAVDLVRYHLLHDGIRFGLLSSGLSIGTPSWLWTIDFLGGFGVPLSLQRIKTKMIELPTRILAWYNRNRKARFRSIHSDLARSRLFLCFVLVSFTLLSTTVGPASALLFIPTQHWIPSARTIFYIRGTPAMLWPETLGSNHTGIPQCSLSPVRIDMDSCLNGGWKKLVAAVERISPIIPQWSIFIAGGVPYQIPPARTMLGGTSEWTPQPAIRPDTWATTAHAAVASHAGYLSHQVTQAFNRARGRNKRLRNFGSNDLMIASGGKFPVARVQCSNVTESHGSDTLVPFPVLTRGVTWRPPFHPGPGPTKQIDLTTQGIGSWVESTHFGATTDKQVRAKWFPFPKDLGSGSAALLYLVQNQTRTFARGCVAEAWWTHGQVLQSSQSFMYAWSVRPGAQNLHGGGEDIPLDWEGGLYFPPFVPFYENTIKIEQAWLDALAPMMPEASLPGNGLVMTSYEALLNQSYMNNLDWVLENMDESSIHLEYVTSMFLINAISRVGLMYQLVHAHDIALDPLLLSNDITDDSFISGADIYNKRDPSEPFIPCRFESYIWGTAWTLINPAQQAATALLCTHMFLALIHTVVLFCAGCSSDAWDSINELVVLAYNSLPCTGAFENCSSGVFHARTLEKQVRVGTRTLDSGDVQSELVVCGDHDNAGNIKADEAYS